MAITCALGAGYLLAWGYRSVALLRTVVLLSLLTWGPIANSAHTIVRSSLEQPSDLIYQRLAQFQQFGVHDEPWRLFTASLHRGSLVVIAAVIFAIAGEPLAGLGTRCSSTWAPRLRSALVLHHVVVLLSPVDVYNPSRADQVADTTDDGDPDRRDRRQHAGRRPLAARAALGGAAIERARGHRRRRNVADRDPVIFALDRVDGSRGRPPAWIALGLLPTRRARDHHLNPTPAPLHPSATHTPAPLHTSATPHPAPLHTSATPPQRTPPVPQRFGGSPVTIVVPLDAALPDTALPDTGPADVGRTDRGPSRGPHRSSRRHRDVVVRAGRRPSASSSSRRSPASASAVR